MATVRPSLLVLLLVAASCPAVLCRPGAANGLDDHSLFSKLQTCFSASGMAELDAPLNPDQMPTVSRRNDILQAFLDCCSKQDFPGLEALETKKVAPEVSAQLRTFREKIHTIYKKYLKGSSVGIDMTGA